MTHYFNQVSECRGKGVGVLITSGRASGVYQFLPLNPKAWQLFGEHGRSSDSVLLILPGGWPTSGLIVSFVKG